MDDSQLIGMAQTNQIANTLTGSEFIPQKSRPVKLHRYSDTLQPDSL